jgi:hypothetical protein
VCKTARRKFLAGVKQFALKTSAKVADFIARRLTMTPQGELLCDDDATSAFGFVTGYLPAGLRMALRMDARDDDTSVRQFTHWLRRYCKRKLWRPTWEAAKAAGLAASVENDAGKDVCMRCGETTLVYDGGVMGEVLVCEGCDGEVHLNCSGLDDMPEDDLPYYCGCDEVDCDDEDGDDADNEDDDDADDAGDGDDGGDGGARDDGGDETGYTSDDLVQDGVLDAVDGSVGDEYCK